MKWIPVTERMPEPNVDVLIWGPAFTWSDVGEWIPEQDDIYGHLDAGWWTVDAYDGRIKGEVTHWMHYPDPPVIP